METKKLYRSQTDKMIAGVCGGLGRYFGIDTTLIRLLFALAVVVGFGGGFLVYLVMMIVVPLEPAAPPSYVEPAPAETPKTEG